nr:hypothetical protein GCM10020092_036450 [Actinoplanes digitatis]
MVLGLRRLPVVIEYDSVTLRSARWVKVRFVVRSAAVVTMPMRDGESTVWPLLDTANVRLPPSRTTWATVGEPADGPATVQVVAADADPGATSTAVAAGRSRASASGDRGMGGTPCYAGESVSCETTSGSLRRCRSR